MTTTQISQLYVSIFNRAVEGDGIITWTSEANMQRSTSEIATIMLETSDAKNYFGDSLNSNLDFVKHIYLNTLNKTYSDDKAGIDSWASSIDNGTMSRGEAVEQIISAIADWSVGGKYADIADETTQQAALQFNNRVEVSNYMAQNVPIHSDNYATQTSFNADLTVTSQTQTLQDAKTFIDDLSKSNTIDTLTDLSTVDTTGVSSLLSGDYWDSNLDTITYSFNTTIPDDYELYPYTDLTDGWGALSGQSQDAVNLAMQDASSYLAVSFEQVASDGLIQLNMLEMDSYTSGFAFIPGTLRSYGGDIFFNNDLNIEDKNLTILHELGHALGLKHPFEGENQLPTSLDDINHSIMSYTAQNSYVPLLSFSSSQIFMDYTQLQPDSYSLYDIAALQSIYGVNTTTNTQDNIYTSSFKEHQIQTLWDAGGIDTIDLSNTTGSSTIDINDATLNTADKKTLEDVIDIYQNIAEQNNKSQHNDWIQEQITHLYNTNNLYTGIDNLAIATGTVIENITTGSGSDTITDNEVNNIINTGAGNDKIYLGNGGYDIVDGGAGDDTLYLNLLQSDVTLSKFQDSYYLKADSFTAYFTNIEQLDLIDGVFTPDLFIG